MFDEPCVGDFLTLSYSELTRLVFELKFDFFNPRLEVAAFPELFVPLKFAFENKASFEALD